MKKVVVGVLGLICCKAQNGNEKFEVTKFLQNLMLLVLPRPLNVSEITVVGLEFKNTRIATNRKRELKVANLLYEGY